MRFALPDTVTREDLGVLPEAATVGQIRRTKWREAVYRPDGKAIAIAYVTGIDGSHVI